MATKRRRKKSAKTSPKRAAGSVVLGSVAGVLMSMASAPAPAMPQQLSDAAIAKLSPGALRRLLLNLRQEEQETKKGGLILAADHDSHVMHGSHSSFGSHGQHTSFTNSTR